MKVVNPYTPDEYKYETGYQKYLENILTHIYQKDVAWLN